MGRCGRTWRSKILKIEDSSVAAAECATDPKGTDPKVEENDDKIGDYNEEMSLGFDEADIEYYTKLFKKYGRYPTDIELYDLENLITFVISFLVFPQEHLNISKE